MEIRMRFKTLAAAALALALSAGVAAASKVVVSISKVNQKMSVKVDGETKYVWLVSTGAGKYATPSGKFRPFRLEKEHFSKEWDDAPMPNSIFFTGQGHAVHGSFHTKRLGTAASHGCIRLAPANAAILFALVSKNGLSNTTIEVKGGFSFFSEPLTDGTKPVKAKAGKGKRSRLFGDLFN
jgi:lipoprotein-anchoring transpeptidase ErfK/SrfK